MGLLTRIAAGQEQKRQPKPPEAEEQKPNPKSVPAGEPKPCEKCGASIFWRSTAGGLHCPVCEPWPTQHLVDDCFVILTHPDGTTSFAPHRPGSQKADRAPSVANADGWKIDETPHWYVFRKEDSRR